MGAWFSSALRCVRAWWAAAVRRLTRDGSPAGDELTRSLVRDERSREGAQQPTAEPPAKRPPTAEGEPKRDAGARGPPKSPFREDVEPPKRPRLSFYSEVSEVYPPLALHKDLFNPELVGSWLIPPLRDALAGWRSSRDPRDIDVSKLPGVRLETAGVISFQCLTDEFCDKLLAEVAHYMESGLPHRPPNSMNNYGLVLNEVGMKPVFSALLADFLLGVGARLFGGEEVRETSLHGSPLCTADWGGSSLDEHHTFVVQYRPDQDRHLDMHIDDCDVTFNFGLQENGSFSGSDLAFCGMRGSATHRKEALRYRHERGRCVVHSGKMRHGALSIESGERCNLILWSKSKHYRFSNKYALMAYGPTEKEQLPPDAVCLSQTWDYDYGTWAAKSAKG